MLTTDYTSLPGHDPLPLGRHATLFSPHPCLSLFPFLGRFSYRLTHFAALFFFWLSFLVYIICLSPLSSPSFVVVGVVTFYYYFVTFSFFIHLSLLFAFLSIHFLALSLPSFRCNSLLFSCFFFSPILYFHPLFPALDVFSHSASLYSRSH